MEDGAGHVEQRTRARLLKRLALLAAIGSLQGATPDPPTVLINATLISWMENHMYHFVFNRGSGSILILNSFGGVPCNKC